VDILYLLIPLSVVLVIAIGAFFWFAVSRGQFEDLEREGEAVVSDREGEAPPCGGASPSD